jgi:hypothetical protein
MNWLPRESEEAMEIERKKVELDQIYHRSTTNVFNFNEMTAKESVSMMHRELARRKALEQVWVENECKAVRAELAQCEFEYPIKAISMFFCMKPTTNYVLCRENNRVRLHDQEEVFCLVLWFF